MITETFISYIGTIHVLSSVAVYLLHFMPWKQNQERMWHIFLTSQANSKIGNIKISCFTQNPETANEKFPTIEHDLYFINLKLNITL